MSAHHSSLPEALLQSLEGIPGFDRAAFCETHAIQAPVTSIRLNPAKMAASADYGFHVDSPVTWAQQGLYLKERPSFTLDPLFHAGAYYVQEASSMFLEQVLCQIVDITKPLKVLDLCAAPGGKSTHLQSLISADSLLVSNEVIKSRSGILQENLTKWGGINVVVTQNDPADFNRLPGFFDVIVVDAPCSGSGMFRKDAAVVNEWSLEHVSLCSHRQKRILSDVLPALKEGGLLIYATCSYSTSENEAVVDWLMDEEGMSSCSLSIDAFKGVIPTQSKHKNGWGYRFYPHLLKGEGFFIAAFRKNDSLSVDRQKYPLAKTEKTANKNLTALQSWLDTPQSLCFFNQNEDIVAFPFSLQQELEIIKHALYIKKAGIIIGTPARDTLIPAHDWAMSTIQSDILPTLALDKEQALQYLRHQSFDYPEGLKGWQLVTYAGVSLGLVKCMPGRINNYYPRDWRILNK